MHQYLWLMATLYWRFKMTHYRLKRSILWAAGLWSVAIASFVVISTLARHQATGFNGYDMKLDPTSAYPSHAVYIGQDASFRQGESGHMLLGLEIDGRLVQVMFSTRIVVPDTPSDSSGVMLTNGGRFSTDVSGKDTTDRLAEVLNPHNEPYPDPYRSGTYKRKARSVFMGTHTGQASLLYVVLVQDESARYEPIREQDIRDAKWRYMRCPHIEQFGNNVETI
jgi:hypothetical protein